MEAQYFVEKLSALDGTEGPGNYLEVIVNNLRIKDKKSHQAEILTAEKNKTLSSTLELKTTLPKAAIPASPASSGGGMFSNLKANMGLGSLVSGEKSAASTSSSTTPSSNSAADTLKKNLMSNLGFGKMMSGKK